MKVVHGEGNVLGIALRERRGGRARSKGGREGERQGERKEQGREGGREAGREEGAREGEREGGREGGKEGGSYQTGEAVDVTGVYLVEYPNLSILSGFGHTMCIIMEQDPLILRNTSAQRPVMMGYSRGFCYC